MSTVTRHTSASDLSNKAKSATSSPIPPNTT